MPPISTEMNVIVSGNKRTEKQVIKALEGAGFTIKPPDANRAPLPPEDPTFGLPSHADPRAAQTAGHPNAGHQPGTNHPSTLRWLVLEEDHEPGCTRLSPQEWIDVHPEWKPKVLARSVMGKDDDGKDIVHLVEESIYEDDERLFLPCAHVGTLEERGWGSKHVGEPYEADPRVCFVRAAIPCTSEGEAMSAAVTSAHDAVEDLGWTLRSHWETQVVPPKRTSDLELLLEDSGRRIAALESALGNHRSTSELKGV